MKRVSDSADRDADIDVLTCPCYSLCRVNHLVSESL